MYDVIVIGGGAAGMMAAIAAAREKASVLILEHMELCGKKILSTGNGRCNYTNKMQGIEYYRGDDPAFVLPALEQFGCEQTIRFFQSIGIEPKEKNGYVYPRSMQAASVREALLLELRRQRVKIELGCGIRQILPKKGSYEICTKNGNFHAKTCILATGGKAAKHTGSDGSGFLYLEPLSHHVIDLVPALTGLQAKPPFPKNLAGIRAEAEVKLFVENAQIASDFGEVQMTAEGISGIPVFQVSRFAAKALVNGKKVCAEVDFFPEYDSLNELEEYLTGRMNWMRDRTIREALEGLLADKLIDTALKEIGLSSKKQAGDCTKQEVKVLAKYLKQFTCEIMSTRKFEQSQATAGGVSTQEICANTMESKLCPGLFFAGEVIDIDGMCGGYNLQWAWTSGYVAGTSAAKKARQSESGKGQK